MRPPKSSIAKEDGIERRTIREERGNAKFPLRLVVGP
jgi:hypothetical protein